MATEIRQFTLAVLMCCALVSVAAQPSIRNVDWKNFAYPLQDFDDVPGEVRWMPAVKTETVSLVRGEYTLLDCSDDPRSCPSVTFDSATYGTLTGVNSTVAAVVLTYHTGGTAGWQYVYLFSLKSGKPRLLAWLRTGSRGSQGLRDVSISGGQLVLSVNDPDKRSGDCCSMGTITTRYRWTGSSFSAIGSPVYKNDPPSFDCAKAVTPVEHLICEDAELSFLDRQMAESYRAALKSASTERKRIIQKQQAEWFAEYRQTCNSAALSDEQRRDCIDEHLSDRLVAIWK